MAFCRPTPGDRCRVTEREASRAAKFDARGRSYANGCCP